MAGQWLCRGALRSDSTIVPRPWIRYLSISRCCCREANRTTPSGALPPTWPLPSVRHLRHRDRKIKRSTRPRQPNLDTPLLVLTTPPATAALPLAMPGPSGQAGLLDLLDDILLRISSHLSLQERLRLPGGCGRRSVLLTRAHHMRSRAQALALASNTLACLPPSSPCNRGLSQVEAPAVGAQRGLAAVGSSCGA